ncbi:hypothetical protein AX16_006808 [Volvariella volvacea WC 439]|nr:hypothetical protein AX16_006808 [Volvariella volvacea WC 439]
MTSVSTGGSAEREVEARTALLVRNEQGYIYQQQVPTTFGLSGISSFVALQDEALTERDILKKSALGSIRELRKLDVASGIDLDRKPSLNQSAKDPPANQPLVLS